MIQNEPVPTAQCGCCSYRWAETDIPLDNQSVKTIFELRYGTSMAETLRQAHFQGISPGEWEFVKNLLRDLQAEENREQIASLFGQWRLSIKAFRRVEEGRMIRQDPEPLDLLCHKVCVTNLMSFGTMLLVLAEEHTDQELAQHGLRRDIIDSLVRDLHNTLDEWHGQVPDGRIEELKQKIFDVPPELNLKDSRG